MQRLYLLVICWLAAVTGSDAAALSRPFRVGTWSGGASINAQTKAFERCTATSTSNGTTITYSLDHQFRWDLSVSSPAWSFGSGTVWNAYLKVGETSGTIPARAVSSAASILDIKVEHPIDLVALLSSARQMRMVAGAAGFDFAVGGSGEVLAALTRCVVQSTRPAVARAKKPGPDALSGVLDPAAAEEATALVANIGAYGGAGEAKIVPAPDELSRLPVQAVWKTGLVTASVMVLNGTVKVNRVAAILLDHWQAACRGDLAFIAEASTAGQAPITRVFTSCQTAETTVSLYQFAIERPKGGVYVVSTLRPTNAFADNLQKLADLYEKGLRGMISIAIAKLP